MVAGYETMRQMTEEEYQRLDQLGVYLKKRLSEMMDRRGLAHKIQGRGSLFSILLSDQATADFRDVAAIRAFRPELSRVVYEMLARGVLLGARGLFGALSTPMTEVEMDLFVDALEGSFDALEIR
jgi:glutamate-1-semialdehyde 2,1-aminomutase